MKLFLILICTGWCSGVIYRLNDTEYVRMPKLIRLDPYEECLLEPEALYCSARFTLVSDSPSPLLDMIKEYSEYTVGHYNHSRVFQGLCMQKRCKELITNSSADLYSQIEACMNKTMWEEYRLKTNILAEVSCSNDEDSADASDVAMAVVVFILLMLNVCGTLYDVIFVTGNPSEGVKYLTCFSIRRNLEKLTKDRAKEDPRFRTLKGLNGARTISMALVIFAHSIIAYGINVKNSHVIEMLHFSAFIQILANGPGVVMHIFFMMSSLLLINSCCLCAERHKCGWRMVVLALLRRWLRLTPAYALVLAFTATWMRHLGSGPLWNTMVKMETLDCRQYWWWHMIYLNNYNNHSMCMLESWYLAADMQLFFVGVLFFVFCRSKMKRIIVLSVLFVISIIIPALNTYFQDLDATLMFMPEHARDNFVTYETFNYDYKRGHTNILGFVIGLSLGYLIYYWKDTGIDIEKYKKYRVLYWCWLPALLSILYTGRIFYAEGPRLSVWIRTFYAALVRPVCDILLAVAILGTVLKYENLYRSILEWDGWTVFSKLCYSAYLVHTPILRYTTGVQTDIAKWSYVYIVNSYSGVMVFSFVGAFFLWMLVEQPFDQLAKMMFAKLEKYDALEEKVK